MTRPAPTHAAKSPASEVAALPPCMANPQLWDSTDNTEAIAACRRLCPRRVACAQEVLSNVQNIDGVVAGVALPAQNEHGTSKRRRAAVQHIQAIAAQQPQPTKADPTTQPGPAGSRRGYHAHHGSAGQPEIADRDRAATKTTTRPATAQRSCGTTAVIERADDTSSRHVNQTEAAELTGLSKDYLKQLRRLRKGPKWWRTATGEVRYWVIDIEKWMSRRQRSQILSGGRRRNHHRSAANYPHPKRPIEQSTPRQLSLFESPDAVAPEWSAPGTVRHLAAHQGFFDSTSRPRQLHPGQCDLAGAALITGLTHNRLRVHHADGTGPKSWVSGGGIRYWEADVRAWKEQLPNHSGEESTATQPIAQAS